MKYLIAIVVATYAMVVFSVEYHDFCTNAIHAISANIAGTTSFTNQVISYIDGETGTNRASAKLVLSVALFDIYESSSDVVALDGCIECCTNVMGGADCPDVSWQKSAASAVLSTALATKRQYEDALSVCTNALVRYVAMPVSDDDVALWGALCSHQFLPGLSIHDTLNFYSAMSLVFHGDIQAMAQYTNSLPTVALQKLREAME